MTDRNHDNQICSLFYLNLYLSPHVYPQLLLSLSLPLSLSFSLSLSNYLDAKAAVADDDAAAVERQLSIALAESRLLSGKRRLFGFVNLPMRFRAIRSIFRQANTLPTSTSFYTERLDRLVIACLTCPLLCSSLPLLFLCAFLSQSLVHSNLPPPPPSPPPPSISSADILL